MSSMDRIFPEGKWPSQAQLSTLEFSPDGFAHWFQYDHTQPEGVVVHVVARSHDRGGRPCIRTAGVIPVTHPTIENRGVPVAVMAGEYSHHIVPSMYDAYKLIKSEWALNL